MDRVEESQSEVETSIQLDSKNSSAHYLLGRIYRKQGKTGLAGREFSLTEQLIRKERAHSTGMGGTMDRVERKEMPQ